MYANVAIFCGNGRIAYHEFFATLAPARASRYSARMSSAAPTLASTTTRQEIARRRTFAIISHPDAGKTTITEKLLLFGNAIHLAGMVRAKRSKQFTTSDWMEIERQRGISVTSSVMQFEYGDCAINLLDTPGHQDFSEDTYRVLTAVDSALMVIDSTKGIETQTRKLFAVCRERNIPIMTFINKMDLAGRDPFELIDQVEKELQLHCAVMTWPIGQGREFAGVFDRAATALRLFDPNRSTRDFEQIVARDLHDVAVTSRIEASLLEKLREDLSLLDGASRPFNLEEYRAGDLTPIFFGSARDNFGVQELLNAFVHYAPPPQSRAALERAVAPDEAHFSGVVFKIQANMDPKHRDRIAFVRICSGEFLPGMDAYHVRDEKFFKINNALQFLSKERRHVESACAGDVIGLHDRGNLTIGDTLTHGETLHFTGIPQFAPDLFALVQLKNPIKVKQLHKGLDHLSEEGASQIFRRKHTSDTIIGVVGQLQFEVVKYRLLHEYSADAEFIGLPIVSSRWFTAPDGDRENFERNYREQVVYDTRGYPMMLFKSEWEQSYVAQKNPTVQFFTSLLGYEQSVRAA